MITGTSRRHSLRAAVTFPARRRHLLRPLVPHLHVVAHRPHDAVGQRSGAGWRRRAAPYLWETAAAPLLPAAWICSPAAAFCAAAVAAALPPRARRRWSNAFGTRAGGAIVRP